MPVAEHPAHQAGQHRVAEAVAAPVGGIDFGDPRAVDHVELLVQQQAAPSRVQLAAS